MTLTTGALFAGYGGIELAVEDVFGARPAWVSEFDKAPSKILAHHWPDAPNLGDITKVNWADVEPVDILTGGFPCQDVSHAGKRAGLKGGTRSGLWAHMCNAVANLRPSLVIAENVRGLLSAEGEEPNDHILTAEANRDHLARSLNLVRRKLANATTQGATFHVQQHTKDAIRLARLHKRAVGAVRRARAGLVRAIGTVLRDLADIGYDTAWCGLRAADVGAPHGRFRIFVIAWPVNDPAALNWPVNDPAALNWPVNDPAALLPTPVVNDMGASYTPETWDEWTARLKASHGNGNGHGASLSIEALRLLPTPSVADATGGHANRSGDRSHELLLPGVVRSVDFGTYTPAITRWEALTRPAPSPTEPTGRDGAHRLSPRFVEWMQGLPDGWVTDPAIDISRNEQLKALGNGVVPQQGAAAVRHLLGVMAAHTTEAVAS